MWFVNIGKKRAFCCFCFCYPLSAHRRTQILQKSAVPTCHTICRLFLNSVRLRCCNIQPARMQVTRLACGCKSCVPSWPPPLHGGRGVSLSHPDRARILTHAAQAVCTACIVQVLGLAVGAEVHMHTRPTLLLRKHKQGTAHHHHVLTAFMDHAGRSALLHLCARAPARLHSSADLHCQAGLESVRVWLLPPADFQRLQNARRGDNGRAHQRVPGLVEVFFYKTSATSMWLVDAHGAQSAPAHAVQFFFFFRWSPFSLAEPASWVLDMTYVREQTVRVFAIEHRPRPGGAGRHVLLEVG